MSVVEYIAIGIILPFVFGFLISLFMTAVMRD